MSTHLPSLEALLELAALERTLAPRGVEGLLEALAQLRSAAPEPVPLPDTTTQLSTRTVEILERALALDADFLEAHPEALFQSLYNRLRWFDAPDAAAFFAPGPPGPWDDATAHLHLLAQRWRSQFEARAEPWIEALRPLPGTLPFDERVYRPEGPILCATYSPSGEQLAIGTRGDAGNLSVWDRASVRCELTLEGHDNDVRAVAFSPDGARLASGGRDHALCVWDVTDGRLAFRLEGLAGAVTAVAFTPDGRTLVAANLGGQVQVIDVASGRLRHTFGGHRPSVLTVAVHPSGQWVASGASDDTVRIWSLDAGEPLACIEALTGVTSLDFSPDGATLAIATMEGIVRVASDGWRREAALAPERAFAQVRWLEDGRLGAQASGQFEILEPSSGSHLLRRALPPNRGTPVLAFRPGGSHVAIATEDGRLLERALDAPDVPQLLAERERVRSLWGHDGGRYAVLRLQDGFQLLGATGEVRALPFEARLAPLQPWVVHPEDAMIALPLRQTGGPGSGAGIAVLDAASLALRFTLGLAPDERPSSRPPADPVSIAFSPDGSLLAGAIVEGRVHLWRTSDGALLQRLDGPGPVSALAFTQNGSHLVVAHRDDDRLRLHGTADGVLRFDLEVIVHPTLPFDSVGDAPLAAAGTEDGRLLRLNLETGEVRPLLVSDAPILAVAISEDGRLLAACAEDGEVQVVGADHGEVIATVSHPVPAFAAALDAERLVTQTEDGLLHLFELPTGRTLATLEGHASPEDVLRAPRWERFSDGPVALHRPHEASPIAHFQDPLEELQTLAGDLLLGRGQTERDLLYVLRVHDPEAGGRR